MKIAMLGSFPPQRGISSYCFELTCALARRVAMDFISFKHMYPRILYPGGGLADDNTFPSMLPSRLIVRRNLTWYNPLSWLKEMLNSQADLLHVQWWSIPLAPVAACVALGYKLRGKPVVFTIHNVIGHERRTLFRKVSATLFKLGDHFIVHTAANRDILVQSFKIAPQRVCRVPHGILGFFRPPEVDRDEIRNCFGYRQHHRVILLFGAIRPYKGLLTALRAFAAVHRRLPDVRLLVAGKLWESWIPYQRMIDRLGIGEVVQCHLDYVPADRVYRYISAADLVGLPYVQFDSQSGVGSTALAFHKPMIVTDVGGLPDLTPDRRFIVPPGDANSLTEATILSLTDPALLQQMTRNAELLSKALQWPDIARRTLSIYQSILGKELRKNGTAVE
jgi:glycosyltransferase involved in cell wall biosynthesis